MKNKFDAGEWFVENETNEKNICVSLSNYRNLYAISYDNGVITYSLWCNFQHSPLIDYESKLIKPFRITLNKENKLEVEKYLLDIDWNYFIDIGVDTEIPCGASPNSIEFKINDFQGQCLTYFDTPKLYDEIGEFLYKYIEKQQNNCSHKYEISPRQDIYDAVEMMCSKCGNTYIESIIDKGDNKNHLSDPLEPFEDLINLETDITSKQIKEYIKKLNRNVFGMKRLAGFLLLILLPGGVFATKNGLPHFFVVVALVLIWYFSLAKKYSTIKKTIVSLKTKYKMDSYIERIEQVKLNDMPFRYDSSAVYGKNNAIFSTDNICLIYTVGKRVTFGTIKGELVDFDVSLNKEQQDWLIKFFQKNNPNILIGIEFASEIRQLIGT